MGGTAGPAAALVITTARSRYRGAERTGAILADAAGTGIIVGPLSAAMLPTPVALWAGVACGAAGRGGLRHGESKDSCGEDTSQAAHGLPP